MNWKIEWDERAIKDAKKLDHSGRRRILDYLKNRIATNEDPRHFGKPLTGDKAGLWRYRIGDYRLVCNIEEDKLTVLVVTVGHRKSVYD